MTATAGPRPSRHPQPRRTAGGGTRLAWARPSGLGLRGRTTLALAAVALLLSLTVGVTVWLSVSHYLVNRRTEAAVWQTRTNVEQVGRGLSSPGVSTPQLLAQLPRPHGSISMVRVGGRWSTTSLEIDQKSLPAKLTSGVAAGQPMHQRIATDHGPQLVVGFPLAGTGNAYFEVFPLIELDQTLQTLSTTLWTLMIAVPIAAVLLERWALRPAFRPLDRVGDAAAAIATGDLSARLDARGDPGLTAIAASFNQTAAALERRVRADAKFAADVSHELRSPLTTMLTAVDIFEGQRAALTADGQVALDLLRAEVQGFERLVGDLLEISRADAGSADLALETVLLSEFVAQTVPHRLQDRVAMGPSADVPVCVDKRRLERVVMNLIDNAERHGHGLARVEVHSTPEEGHVCVEDHGPGIDHNERERIFDRFARGRRTGRDSGDGAGLGLSLVARYLNLMHGRVSVSDVPGGGARFTVTLPRHQD